MKVSKDIENEVLRVHRIFWESYAQRDIELRFSLCSEDITFIGSGLHERATNKTEYKKINQEGVKQFPNHFQIEFLWTNLSMINENVACIESEVLWSQLINDKTSKELLRNTTLLKFDKDKWLVTHVHGSVPDYRLKDGDYMTNEQTIIRNKELERQVFERTLDLTKTLEELEQKNRELEVEAALEKVRTIAMGMREPAHMLDVCKTISCQLQALGVKEIRNVQTAIFYEQRGTYMNYEYYAKHNKTIITETSYTNHKMHTEFALKMLKGKGEIFITHINGKEVKDWIAYQKTTNVFIDEYLETASSVNYYWFSLGPVALGISTYIPLTETDIKLFKRFLKVFELAYQRYLDIEKAEAQAREAKIEASLERVRSRSMAMQQSSDLHEVIKVVTEQLCELGIKFNVANFAKVHSEGSWDLWISTPEQSYPALVHVPYLNHRLFNNLIEIISNGVDFLADVYDQEEKNIFFKHFFENTLAKNTPEERKQFVMNCKGLARSIFLTKNIWLAISNYGGIPFSDAENAIFKRFAAVFEQTYTRFLDLQKAEAQAREAQIETALERVRSRTMGMQKSDELKAVIQVVYEQFVFLKIPVEHTGFIMDYKTRDDMNIWLADSHEVPTQITIPYFDSPHWNSFVEAKEMGNNFFVNHLSFEEKNKFYQDLFKLFPVTDEAKEYYFGCPGLAISTVLLENVGLYIENFSGIPFTDKENKTLMRFGKVFQQTYTRFLDLQKAEAQAIEAQIEAALERVRSRAMAMQTSEELNALIGTVFVELTKLDLVLTRCVILIYEGNEKGVRWWMANSEAPSMPMNFFVKYADLPFFNAYLQGWNERILKWQYVLEGDNKIKTDDFLFGETELSLLPDFVIEGMRAPDRVYLNASFNNFGNLTLASLELLSEEHFNILIRFAKVFDLTYTRLNDLKQAEAQASEAKIELALERVRSRAMAMHSPNDLSETVNVFFKELKTLGIIPIRCGVGQIEEATRTTSLTTTTSSQQGETFRVIGKIKQTGHPVLDGIFDHWKLQKEYHPVLQGEDINVYYNVMNPQIGYPEYPAEITQYGNIFFFKEGFVFAWTANLLSEEELIIFRRFTSVLSLTYRRYLDLKEAEEQAKEAKIEASLEKVRTVALSLKKSDEMLDIAQVLYEQLIELGFTNIRNAIIDIHNDTNQTFLDYDYSHDMGRTVTLMSYYDDPIIEKQVREIESSSDAFFELILEGQDLQDLIDVRLKNGEEEDPRLQQIKQLTYNLYSFGNGAIGISNFGLLSDEQKLVLKRFRNVFAFAYKRYSDLAQAESQAREAKIEAALEKVRALAMAMHNSDDLSAASSMVFTELRKLGINPLRTGVGLLSKNSRKAQIYTTTMNLESNALALIGSLELSTHPCLEMQYDSWLKNENYFPVLGAQELKSYYEALSAQLSLPILPDEQFQHEEYGYYLSFSEGLFYAWSDKPYSESELNILNRFKAIIDLTFRRYLDIQKAEAQAREAKIEAALERVRSKAMAMNNSEEFLATVATFYNELSSLSHTPRRCGVGLINKETRITELSTLNTTDKGDSVEVIGKIKLEGHPVLCNIYDNWVTKNEYHPVLKGNEIKEYYKLIRPQISIPDYSNDQVHYGYFFYFNEGGVYTWTEKELTEDELQIYRRFTSVLSLTYRRYLDLQEAETRALEAVRQASLDRIRAQIASMRTTEDLNHITPIIWGELKILKVPFFRCGVFIVDEANDCVHVYLTTPDGKSLGVLNLSFDDNKLTGDTVEHWRKKKIFKVHWNKEEFVTWTHSMIQIGQVQSEKTYQGSAEPPESLDLHFVPFTQGMLYVGNTIPLTEAELDLVKSLAEAFSIAYARYEDFKNLEEAKNKIEVTLKELRSAQVQLIHSEKMASLGELTAGIAHEIKNPLNFVNNFSEISNELLDEMKTELGNKNNEEVLGLIENLKQNLEKINQHGKRADSIVKGMLLHSRGSSGEKTLTDINDLLDQYVTLAYHGLRAQDKEFNITIEKHYDDTLRKINVVPQDLSRVFLNIINNACYAAYDKKKKSYDGFSPLLKVSTKGFNGKVEIRIGDNGNGIPADILDKIFQPFFTTKPTGEGTGLGLSMAYDIVKAHGGELKVETKESEGSEFIIQLRTN